MTEVLTVGEIVQGTLATLSQRRTEAMIYVGALTVVGSLIHIALDHVDEASFDVSDSTATVMLLFGLGVGIGSIVVLILSTLAQYLLWEALLREPVQMPRGGRRLLGFFALQMLMALGIGIGTILLIIPGLFVFARWAAAPAFLIDERLGILDSMRASWSELRGNTTPVILAAICVTAGYAIGHVVFGFVTGGLGERLSESAATGVGVVFTELASNVVAVLATGVGVYLFDRLHGRTGPLIEVFE